MFAQILHCCLYINIHYDFHLVSRYSGGVFTKIWQFDPYPCGWHCWEASGDLPWELLAATQVRQCLSLSSQFVPFQESGKTSSSLRANLVYSQWYYTLPSDTRQKNKQTSACVVKKANGSKAQKSLSLLVLQVSRPYLWLYRSSLNSLKRGRLCSYKIDVALFTTLHGYRLGRSFRVMPAILLHTLTTQSSLFLFFKETDPSQQIKEKKSTQ